MNWMFAGFICILVSVFLGTATCANFDYAGVQRASNVGVEVCAGHSGLGELDFSGEYVCKDDTVIIRSPTAK